MVKMNEGEGYVKQERSLFITKYCQYEIKR